MRNENKPRNLGRHFEDRLIAVEKRFRNDLFVQEYRKKTVTLYRRDNPETNALASLPHLAPHLDSVLVDQEGDLYLLRWQRAKIPPGYKILGSRPQSGRDYAANPPKTKIPKRLIYAHFPKGIDVLQRGIGEILDSYLVGKDIPAKEVEQMKKVLSHLLVLKGHVNSFGELSGQNLDQIASSNIEFLEENGFLDPKSPEKQKIQELMARGFRDSLGRKNYLAALTRIYGVELAVVKRNITITRILEKYSGTLAVVELTRDSTRFALQETEKKLGELLDGEAFTTPGFGNFPKEYWIEKARTIWRVLRDRTNLLVRYAQVRPYVLVCRKAIEHFGTIDLPEGTISARVQKSRKEREIPTITDYLRTGDFENASQLIGKVRRMIKRTLDVHADYKTVKLSRKARRL
ncbi:MAG: hypothetical protein Q7K55_07760 [Candidatus Levybacteria bacterium]|nr:hypothetical protein [Candidatus Levybacteria bacterium]